MVAETVQRCHDGNFSQLQIMEILNGVSKASRKLETRGNSPKRRRRLLSRATTKVQSKVATELEPPAMGIIMGLIQALIGAILGGLGPGGIGFGRSDVVIPYLKKHVYESVVADMTEAVATQVYEQVRPQLANHLIHTLAESVMEALQISLTHAIEHSVGNTVSVATTHGVKTMLTTMCKLNDNLYFPAISNLVRI